MTTPVDEPTPPAQDPPKPDDMQPPTPVEPPKPPEPATDWKAEARKWEDRAKANKTAADELAQIKAANQTEAEKAAARAEAAEARAKDLIDRTVRAEIKALTADAFADPSDAHLYVDPAQFVNDEGEVDTVALKEALADVLEKKPHLAKSASTPHGDVGQGARPLADDQLTQLSRDDIKGMTPEAIEKARTEGRLNDLLGIKT